MDGEGSHETAFFQPPASRRDLPKSCRILQGKDFRRAYAKGLRARGPHILLVAAPGLNPNTARLGLSVGRKFSKLAVRRNRARRVIREAFRLCRSELPALDMVVMPLNPRKPFQTQVIRDELVTLTAKILAKMQRPCKG
ncbi:MAG: ribonuclease P protein component [Planctomycetota bacterium]|nr:MAG: ribonuclease P protein component [Planctomycetota bacterium]